MAEAKLYVQRVESLLESGSLEDLEGFLVSNSNLPGPRGNLELAGAFGDVFYRVEPSASQWEMLLGWIGISEQEAPTGNPREFLPFCGLQALGSLYPRVSTERRRMIVDLLRRAAGDGRWRLREGVAMAFQRIGERNFAELRQIFAGWTDSASLQEQRAIVAALAHPPMLGTPENARYCLEVSDRTLKELTRLDPAVRKSEEFRVLRQGLEYAISVFVAPLPEEGFAFLKRWAVVGDLDVKRIVKSNCGKGRIAKKYPERVAEVLALV